MRSKTDIVADLRGMLQGVFAAKAGGESYARLARAHGYVDGFMRALLDLEVLSREEMLSMVSAEREKVSGPAIRVLGDDAFAASDDDVRAA
jgi:hypothetical protein